MLTVVQLFIASLIALSILIGAFVPSLGLGYIASVAPLAIFAWVVRNRSPFVFAPIFGAALSFFAFYFIRPLVLIPNRELYPYQFVSDLSDTLILHALLVNGLFSMAFLSGLYFVMHLRGSKLRLSDAQIRPGIISAFGSRFLILLLFVVLTWVALFAFTGAGRKLVAGWVNILLLIVPISLVIPAAFGYIARASKRKPNAWEKALIAAIISISVLTSLLSGAKEGIFLLILYSFFFLLMVKGNYKIRIISLAIIFIMTIVAVFLAVALANAAKYSTISSSSTTELFWEAVQRRDLHFFLLDKITFRLNGFDGTIAVLTSHPPGFENSANWANILRFGLAQLLPGISVDGFSMGKSVSVEFRELSYDAANAGALGLIGVLYFMHGLMGGFFVAAAIGGFFGLLFRWMASLGTAGPPERLVVFLAMCYLQAFWISSGNFDKLLQELVVVIAHIYFYYFVVRVLHGSRPLRLAPRRSASRIGPIS